jgi:hypothetical protein
MSTLSHRGLVLYRSILRAHKQFLPADMRELGDRYVRSEFKAHRTATKEEHITAFYQEWNKYLEQLNVTARARKTLQDDAQTAEAGRIFAFGSDLPSNVELSEDQLKQLQKLKEETDRLGK